VATPRKHWFKVADSIARDDLSNDELGTMIRLLAMLNTQWARDGLDGEEAARIALRPVDLMACTGSESLARARRIVGALKVKVGLTVDEVGKQTVIFWPKSLEFQDWDSRQQGKRRGEASPRVAPSETQDARRRRKTQDAEKEGRDSAPTPKGYEHPNGIVPMLKLNAKSTKAERSVWAEAVWPEVLAAARIESGGGDSFRDHFVKILSARWNAYLRERDPTRRTYAREARVRSLEEAKAKLDATLDAETPEADDDDPLRFMRAGGNPHASN